MPGDVVLLNAGDVVPGDSLVLTANALQLDASALTGEAYPVENEPGVLDEAVPLAQRTNGVFSGTHCPAGPPRPSLSVPAPRGSSGGSRGDWRRSPPRTGFEQGLNRFRMMLISATAVLLVAIFAVNLALNRPVIDSLLFSLSLAIGHHPAAPAGDRRHRLAAGAERMARGEVIVKRLDAIEDFGSMDVLCTDKTGTITEGTVRLALQRTSAAPRASGFSRTRA